MTEISENSICPQCEKGRLRAGRKPSTFRYGGRNTKLFQNEKVFQCSICDFEGLSHEDNARVDAELEKFRDRIERKG